MAEIATGVQSASKIIALLLGVYCIGDLVSKAIPICHILVGNIFTDIPVLNQKYFWMIVLFSVATLFSFRDVASTKYLQLGIIFIRFFLLGCLIFGSIYVIFSTDGPHTLTPGKFGPFRFKGFTQFYNNAIYAFLFHHAIPGIYKPVKPARSIPKTVSLGFITAYIILTTECLTGILAFGDEMYDKKNRTYFCNNF